MRLRRVDCSIPGITRVRCGRGFRYVDAAGARVGDAATLERIKALVIPPAWRDVWICPLANGHLQAVGIDAAGRRQYLYHPRWRDLQDREKFARMERFATALPAVRAATDAHLRLDGMPAERALACAVRLLDRGFFRIGGEEYAEENQSYGLATMLRQHATCTGDEVVFEYPAKWGKTRLQSIVDPAVADVVRVLRRRRGGGPELLAYKSGRTWQDVRSSDINRYLKQLAGDEYSAKDFRTWHATVLAAIALAVSLPAAKAPTTRKRAVARAMSEVAHYLGNTPAVCRRSYVDERVIDRYSAGVTIAPVLVGLARSPLEQPAAQRAVETAVLELLADERATSRTAA
jgi:DNA topoisomerase IB